MPKLYADGLVSDATVSAGARTTPAVREATVVTTNQATEATRETGRKVEKASVWLSMVYVPTLTVGTGVAVTTVRTAGNAAGQATADINSALTDLAKGHNGRISYDGTTVTRRF